MDAAIRVRMMPSDTNPHGTIFGGVILSYIDQAGAIEATRKTGIERFVTVAVREVVFHQPVYMGDIVSFYAGTEKVGNSSITIRVVVEADRFGRNMDAVRVTEAEIVYVAIDENRRKMKIPRPPQQEENPQP